MTNKAKLMEYLAKHPKQAHSLATITAATQVNSPGPALKGLVDSGLATREKLDGKWHYQAKAGKAKGNGKAKAVKEVVAPPAVKEPSAKRLAKDAKQGLPTGASSPDQLQQWDMFQTGVELAEAYHQDGMTWQELRQLQPITQSTEEVEAFRAGWALGELLFSPDVVR